MFRRPEKRLITTDGDGGALNRFPEKAARRVCAGTVKQGLPTREPRQTRGPLVSSKGQKKNNFACYFETG